MALAPLHLQDLKKSGLSDEAIAAAGFYSVPPRDINKIIGFKAPVESMFAIPYPGIADFKRYKLFPAISDKDGHSIKYFQQKGTPPRLFVPPGFDCTAPLWRITEGEKKALKGTEESINVIALGGIWNFAVKNN
ncbi:MAG: hypothetical protein JW812_01255, partial [Alphaproteobacteria bacterium]|nr:hypothetical protein [Alphaproteobacteria bacterium]